MVGPDRPGRRLAVVGECAASARLAQWARDCDVIVHTASSRVRMWTAAQRVSVLVVTFLHFWRVCIAMPDHGCLGPQADA